ncbi:lysophospholipid acyltransferase family protein [Gilliamella sp. ESL0250]|uniref:lysophospholipid acyltransferase family protein n=1 Tax=Gilliamella sp. ESL0250 TaxID=2705036 RepID=UPI00157FC961|nr:lysophospholipid acyltransferase family protein [Gilliamella sp. ESL0250]NUF48715.1 1-acyl-sn-glycerol-3-phosphate acyltransferase [Gilliamella sp. ESL0250]
MDTKFVAKKYRYNLNQYWRLLVTALGFTLFGLCGFFIISLLWFSLLRIFIWNKYQRSIIAQRSVQLSFKIFIWVIKSLGVINYQFNGLEKLKQDNGCLIVANHPSLLDVVLLASVMPRCDCLVKGELLNNVFISRIIKTAGYILNADSEKILPQSQQILAGGGRILIFPEGTRSVPNKPIKLQRGAANIALRCQVDIRIIHIKCDPPCLIKKQKWYDIPIKKACFNITVGEKISIADFISPNTTVAARRLTRHLTSVFTETGKTETGSIERRTNGKTT